MMPQYDCAMIDFKHKILYHSEGEEKEHKVVQLIPFQSLEAGGGGGAFKHPSPSPLFVLYVTLCVNTPYI